MPKKKTAALKLTKPKKDIATTSSPMAKTKNRNIYALSTDIFHSTPDHSQTKYGWNASLCQDFITLFLEIVKMPMKDKLMKPVDNAWTMYLESFTLDDALAPRYAKGYFLSTVDTLKTKLFNSETSEIKDNPKEKADNELQTTCFTFRFSDGLFLLADYGENVVKPNKLADYLNNFIEKSTVPLKNRLTQISFQYLIAKGFLDKLNTFNKLNSLELTIDTVGITGTDDAIAILNKETQKINQKSITLVLKQHDKSGLSVAELKTWATNIFKNHHILEGRIRGRSTPGNPNNLRLSGINEKYQKSFSLNEQNRDVLIEPLFSYIISIIDVRSQILR